MFHVVDAGDVLENPATDGDCSWGGAQNRAGKTRLAKYYVPLADGEKHSLEYDVHRLISTRDPKFTNFVEATSFRCLLE